MITLTTLALAALLAVPTPTARSIEQAFLRNSADLLAPSFPSGGTVLISLPDPISFSDQVSSEQAILLFRRFFSVYKTTEFFVDPEVSFLPGKPGRIIKTRRWSFRNVRTGLVSPIRMYFYVAPDPPGSGREGSPPSWKIFEIRAEKI